MARVFFTSPPKLVIFALTWVAAMVCLPQETQTAPWVNLQALDGFPETEREKIHRYFPSIKRHAEEENLSLSLVLAVIRQESDFNPLAVSRAGARGMMQLMPQTALNLYQRLGGQVEPERIKQSLLSQPELNISLGIHSLAEIQHNFKGVHSDSRRRRLVLAAYNGGYRRLKAAFGCSSTPCLTEQANRLKEPAFQEALTRLPRETESYLKQVHTWTKTYDQHLQTSI